jgi:hypothetical protein
MIEKKFWQVKLREPTLQLRGIRESGVEGGGRRFRLGVSRFTIWNSDDNWAVIH